jgi:hypothetical protein
LIRIATTLNRHEAFIENAVLELIDSELSGKLMIGASSVRSDGDQSAR